MMKRSLKISSQPVFIAAEPILEQLLARIYSLGKWEGPASQKLVDDLYDTEGLPL
jgi:hypothetical protein